MRKTWDETIVQHSLANDESFRRGYRAGWLDVLADFRSTACLTSYWENYADGYKTGQRDCTRERQNS